MNTAPLPPIGLWQGVPNDAYHADNTRVSKSGLDLLARSPAHYHARYLSQKWPRQPPTDAMQAGTAGHELILEPHKFKEHYMLFDDSAQCERIGGAKPRATARYKEWLAGVEAEASGRKLIPPQQYDFFMSLQEAVRSHPIARELLADGVAEATCIFDEPATGAPCKCRPDWLSGKYSALLDLKLVEDASPDGFGKHTANYRYYVQAPFYLDGVNIADASEVYDSFVFVAVEKSPPYAVAVYEAGREIMEAGREEYMRCLDIYMQARKSGEWLSYGTGAIPLKMPAWALKRI